MYFLQMNISRKKVLATLSTFGCLSAICICLYNRRDDYSVIRTYRGTIQDHNFAVYKYRNVTAEKWIVVTTISNPTPDIRFLAKIPGWKVVVVGDTKTPQNWSLKHCIYLDLEDQYGLGYETVENLPFRSYARKTVGYLFAIAHGAKVIYETADDNRPLDLLKNFVLHDGMWALSFSGKGFFNPYRHFGQPTLWPRGYPLSSVGGNYSTAYELNHFKTPSIQQGVVNGDPDMDAIFRLTRTKTLSVLNVTFDERTPPAIVPGGVFSPFNSQNTLFLYDALWALLIPTTTTFRVCDIWRGYWAQRLLWEMGGNLGFFPPNAFQKRNSHSNLLDAKDEKVLYFETERLLEFLAKWKCKPENSFFKCMIQLSTDMSVNKFWKDGDVILTGSWVRDLIDIEYKEPERIPFGTHIETVRTLKTTTLPGQEPSWSDISKVTFWAEEQRPPLKYSKDEIRPMVHHMMRIAPFCNNTHANISLLSPSISLKTFPNILLIVVFNFPHYYNLNFLEAMYRLHFPHILYCGDNKAEFDKHAKHTVVPVSFIEVKLYRGYFAQNCLTQAMKMNYDMDGYLYIGDDTLLNVWNLHALPKDQLWLTNDVKMIRQSVGTRWFWYNNAKFGKKRYEAGIAASKRLDRGHFDEYFRTLTNNSGFTDGLYKALSDIAYVPKRHRDDVIYFLEHFSKFNLFVEMAIPTVFYGIEASNKIYSLEGQYLWFQARGHIEKYFNANDIFLHPAKISKEMKTKKGKQFYCETFLPLTLQVEKNLKSMFYS